MKIAVRYYTKTGNTEKLAHVVGETLEVNVKDISFDLNEKVDLLFLGSAVYAGGVDKRIEAFLEKNAQQIGMVVNFSSAAALHSTYKSIAKLCKKYNIALCDEEYTCRGSFGPFHKNHPNELDFNKLRSFVTSIVKKYQ